MPIYQTIKQKAIKEYKSLQNLTYLATLNW